MYKRVLVVDDDPDIREMMHVLLSRTEFQIVAEGEDGEEAVALYSQVQPDLVLLDLTLPGMDGLPALRRIMQANPHARVIVCSGRRGGDTAREVYEAGAREFIIKPFGRPELLQAFERTAAAP